MLLKHSYMKKNILFTILFFLCFFSDAQTVINMHDGGNSPLLLEKGVDYLFYDQGGEGNNYLNRQDLKLSFQSPENTYISLDFNYFELEIDRAGRCSYDYLNIDYGVSPEVFCGNPGFRTTSSNKLDFIFHSDEYVTKIGWEAKMEVIHSETFFTYDVINLCNWVDMCGLNIKMLTNVYVKFKVYDSNDVLVYDSNTDFTGGWVNKDFSISGLNSGDYYLESVVSSNGRYFSFKNDFTISSNLALISIDEKDPEKNMSAEDLVNNVLVSGCLIAENIEYRGQENKGIGFFESNGSGFPLESGIIMSTGNVASVDQKTYIVASGDLHSALDDVSTSPLTIADINALSDSPYDVQVLEFDFIPAGDKLEFKYIFASEEYPDYACSNYNDVFAFILSGPGITDDPDFNGKNIALTPSGTTVSISNINDQDCGDAQFYVDDMEAGNTVFNGRTDVFYAKATVLPCEVYHIRLILVDVSDGSYDSAVFLEANSFKSNEVIVKNGLQKRSNDIDIMYEGCDGSFIEFSREDNISEEFNFNITLSGPAENGIDYVYSNVAGDNLGTFPENITIPANETVVRYYYKALTDDVIENDEYFQISFLKSCPCNTATPEYYTKKVHIIDVLKIKSSLVTNVQCQSGLPVATISVQLENGLNTSLYEYKFDNNDFQANNVYSIIDPVVGQTHTVEVRDNFACNDPKVLNYQIPDIVPIQSNAGADIQICESHELVLNGTGGIIYEWTCQPSVGKSYLSDTNISNPIISNMALPGTYIYTLTVSDSGLGQCVSADDVEIVINEEPNFTVAIDKTEICSGETVMLTSNVQNTALVQSYEWSPVGDFANPNNKDVSIQIDAANLIAKNFSLTIKYLNSCSLTVDLPTLSVFPNPSILLNEANSVLCTDASDGVLSVDVQGGTPFIAPAEPYIYKWLSPLINNSFIAGSLSAGIYNIEVTDQKNCKSSASFSVYQNLNPKGILTK